MWPRFSSARRVRSSLAAVRHTSGPSTPISLKKPESLGPFFQQKDSQHQAQSSNNGAAAVAGSAPVSHGIGPATPSSLNPFFEVRKPVSSSHTPLKQQHHSQHATKPSAPNSKAPSSPPSVPLPPPVPAPVPATHPPSSSPSAPAKSPDAHASIGTVPSSSSSSSSVPSASLSASVPSSSSATNASTNVTVSGAIPAIHTDPFGAPEPDAVHTQAQQDQKLQQAEMASNEDQAFKTAILQAALLHVPTLGWTEEAIAAGAQELKYASAVTGLFPRGAVELVEFFVQKANSDLSKKLRDSSDLLRDMRTVDKIKTAVRLRLQMLIPFSSNWSQAMALGALPQNLPYTLANIGQLVDEIWHICGDRSTDMNWYTKRALLAGVYTSAELYMLVDQSESYKDTWSFLERRLDEVIALSKAPSQVAAVMENACQFVGQKFFGR